MNILKHYEHQPIIGLAPMDGVSDAPYRLIQKKYGGPDFVMTEFTNVIGLSRGIERLFEDQLYFEEERPIIAQIYGASPEDFYHASKIIAALGFDGIDINMGCPAKNVASSGAGAALIQTPELALEIVRQTQKGVKDYFESHQLTGEWSHKLQKMVEAANTARRLNAEKSGIDLEMAESPEERAANFTVSVKTRIGYRDNIAAEWVKRLTEVEPAWIAVHGRTLKQMYLGQADWDSLAIAASATHLPVFVNGDIDSSERMVQVIKHTGARGALVGRASFGNPWIFSHLDKVRAKIAGKSSEEIVDKRPSLDEILDVMTEHAHLHWQLKNEQAFMQMRKNLAWYIKGIPNAGQFRNQLVRVNNPTEVEVIVSSIRAAA